MVAPATMPASAAPAVMVIDSKFSLHHAYLDPAGVDIDVYDCEDAKNGCGKGNHRQDEQKDLHHRLITLIRLYFEVKKANPEPVILTKSFPNGSGHLPGIGSGRQGHHYPLNQPSII